MNCFKLTVIDIFIFAVIASFAQLTKAQDNIEAGLFTEARQLPVISHGMNVIIERNEAKVTIVQVFLNDRAYRGQADYRLHLPIDAVITEFGYWNNDKYFKAGLQEKEKAKDAHQTAALEGRATGILLKEEGIQQFSVFPVEAGETKKIKLSFSLPVITELGRHRVRVPVDSFLGQGEVMGTVQIKITASNKIEGYGVEGAPANIVRRLEQSINLLLNANAPFELWWKETSVPLQLMGAAVPLENEKYAIELRAAMDDAGAIKNAPEMFSVFVDGSFSMKQKSTDLLFLLERLKKNTPTKIRFYALTDKGIFRQKGDLISMVRALGKGMYGHRTPWSSFENALQKYKCDTPKNVCIVVTDLPTIEEKSLNQINGKTILLSDMHEKTYFANSIEDKKIHIVGVDSSAHLAAMADELVLPVLRINDITSAGHYERIEHQGHQLAEGGRLSIYGKADELHELKVRYAIDNGILKNSNVSIELVAPTSAAGKSIRRGYFKKRLASMMHQFGEMASPELKGKIIEISLREEIPTAFTSLQVDDPSLSLFSIKPGDPILTVHNEPGVVEVIAVYPFGEIKSLKYDAISETYTDRFLVPRGWRDQSYKIIIMKRFSDGHIQKETAYYQIDRKGPKASIVVEPTHKVLRIMPDAHGKNIGSVQVHLSDGRILNITPLNGQFIVYDKDISDKSHIVIRDRAGNTTRFKCERNVEGFYCEAFKKVIPPKDTASVAWVPLIAQGTNLSVNGDIVTAILGKKTVTFSLKKSGLRSLRLNAYDEDKSGNYWIGTVLGDVVKLSCVASNHCSAKPIENSFYGHPISGIIASQKDAVKIAVLGKGIFIYKNKTVTKWKLCAKSRYVTGLVQVDDKLFYSTLKNGLYTILNGKGVKTAFSIQNVFGLSVADKQLKVRTPFGIFKRINDHRFVTTNRRDSFDVGSRDLTAAVEFAGKTIVASFDAGLFQLKNNRLVPLNLSMSAMQQRVNALAVFNNRLYIGTEAGLFTATSLKKLDATSITGAVHDLAVSKSGVAVACTQGLHLIDEKESRRLDYQKVGKGRFMSVAFFKDKIVAGNIDGLFWFGKTDSGQYGAAHHFNANFVTSLLVYDKTLYVGTYDEGVMLYDSGKFKKIKTLGNQWVPPHGLKMINNTLWVGGMGMAPRKWTHGKNTTALSIPARDVNDFFQTKNNVLLLTSDGLVRLPN